LAYNFVIKQPTPISITSGEFVAERLLPVYSAETKYLAATYLKNTAMWKHEIWRPVTRDMFWHQQGTAKLVPWWQKCLNCGRDCVE